MKRIIIHPILLAIYPVLSLFVFNTDELPLQDALLPLVFALAAGLLVWFVISRLVRGKAKAAILTSVFLILFFSFGHATFAVRTFLYSTGLLHTTHLLYESTESLLIWFAVWALLFGLMAFLIRKTSHSLETASQFLNVFSLALILILAGNWAMWHLKQSPISAYSDAWNSTAESLGSSVQPPSAESSRPSIYYIILDGYGREDILKSVYSIDNSEFYSYLTQKGFYIARSSTSNYDQTPLSLASSLNSVYLDDLANKIGDRATSKQPLIAMISNSQLVARLHPLGYKLVSFSTGFPSTEIPSADIYKSPRMQLSAFDNTLLDTTPIPLFLRLPFLMTQYDLHRERILYTLGHLTDVEQPTGPTLVFAHIMAPHPPFVFDANGRSVDPEIPFGFEDGRQYAALYGEKEYAEAYRQQLTFVTARIRPVIDELLSRPNPPIIIIQGDHGPRSTLDWTGLENTNIAEPMSILNAYYFPNHDYHGLYPSITPVNSFKVVLNNYFGTNLTLSQDRNYFSTLELPYLFTDITDKVRIQK